LLSDQLHSQEALIVHLYLIVPILIFHVESVLAILDHVLKLVLRDLQEIVKSFVFSDLSLR